jgi:hypothetical protein
MPSHVRYSSLPSIDEEDKQSRRQPSPARRGPRSKLALLLALWLTYNGFYKLSLVGAETPAQMNGWLGYIGAILVRTLHLSRARSTVGVPC